jgi:hypothetical protein
MAKTKMSKKKPAKKTAAKKKKRSSLTSSEGPLPPKQRAKVLKKLRKMSIPPSHPSSITGPALQLGYEAPLPKKVKAKKKASKHAKKKR